MTLAIPITIVLADTQPLLRHGLRRLFQDQDRCTIVGETSTAENTRALINHHRPDLVITDAGTTNTPDTDLIRDITDHHDQTRVMVVAGDDDPQAMTHCLRAGARAYLLKTTGPDEIVYAAMLVAAGGVALAPPTCHQMLEDRTHVATAPFPTLTRREVEILDLVASGANNRSIARTLVLSEKTIRNTVSNIATKLQTHSRARMIVMARNAGFGRENDDPHSWENVTTLRHQAAATS
jgi:DNA-binding NarL/FixJ family response regulator